MYLTYNNCIFTDLSAVGFSDFETNKYSIVYENHNVSGCASYASSVIAYNIMIKV